MVEADVINCKNMKWTLGRDRIERVEIDRVRIYTKMIFTFCHFPYFIFSNVTKFFFVLDSTFKTFGSLKLEYKDDPLT